MPGIVAGGVKRAAGAPRKAEPASAGFGAGENAFAGGVIAMSRLNWLLTGTGAVHFDSTFPASGSGISLAVDALAPIRPMMVVVRLAPALLDFCTSGVTSATFGGPSLILTISSCAAAGATIGAASGAVDGAAA